MDKIPLIVLFGPTASGKTALAVELCKEMNGEVVTADSMQVYKDMNIGTAKPNQEERQGILHHMIDVAEPTENYNLARYLEEAKACILKIVQKGKLPVLAGGTGLYIDALIGNIQLSHEKSDGLYRKELYAIAETQGNGVLMEKLKMADPETAERLHINDTKRIVRALEIFKETGVPQSEHIRKSKREESPYNAVKFCICADRELLYERINKRVDLMFEEGLLEEVEQLRNRGIDERYTSMQGLGYKEVLWYLEGKCLKEDCMEAIKMGTRRYAKRQVSWFKREENTCLIDMKSEKKLEILKKHIDLYNVL